MTPREARLRLLAHHQQLRDLLGQVTALARRLPTDPAAAPPLLHCVRALSSSFADHNRFEEAWLEPFLAGDPAWGPARLARMREEHAAEHVLMAAALTGPVAVVAVRIADFAEDIDAHMEAEERTFLSSAVLGEDPGRKVLRTRLEKQRRELLVRHQHSRELPDEALASPPSEAADNPVAQWDAQVQSTMGEADRRAVVTISAALRRFDEGRYGRCVACGEAIDEDRLTALPETERCLDCARR